MKLISNLWRIDVIFVTKLMANLWLFYIKRWRWQISFFDDINLSSTTIPKSYVSCYVINDITATSAATSLLTSPPRHLPAWHTAGYDQHKTTSVTKPDRHTTVTSPSVSQADGRLWRKWIVTKSLTALTATSVSQADVKLWRKQGIIYDQKRLSQNEFKSMTTQNSSQIGDTSMTKKPISSPMNKCDATIVTKTKSSQKTNCDHSRVFNDVNVTSLMTTSLLVISAAAGELHTPLALNTVQTFLSLP
jgi:hypothetical protein